MGIISKTIETLSKKETTGNSLGKSLGKALSHPPVRQDSSRVRTPSSADLVFDNVANRRNRSRSIWRQAFDDHEQQKPEHPLPPIPSWGRSAVSTDNATRRLLEALRSFAPGSWTDDRWEQSKHFLGITYVAVHRQNEILTQAEFNVYVKDERHPDGKRPIRPDDPPMGNRAVRPWDLVQLLQNPNKEDDFGDLMSCFPPGTRIRLEDGSYKSIEKMVLGDRVLTAEGNIHNVQQLHSRDYDGDLIQLRLWGHTFLKLTPNHPVLTRRGYVRADELTKNDWVAIPRYTPQQVSVVQTEGHIQGEVVQTKEFWSHRPYGRESREVPGTGGIPWANFKKPSDFLDLTYGFGKILGYYLAEGSSSKSTLTWTFGRHEEHTLVADLVTLLDQELGLVGHVTFRPSTCDVKVNGKLWIRLFHSLCGRLAGHKRLHPDVMSGPEEFVRGVLEGWLAGDGYKQGGKPCGTTTSHDMALNMFDIANRLGMRPAILVDKAPTNQKPDKWGIVSKLPCYRLYLKSEADNSRVKLEDKTMWRRVRRLDRVPYSGKVYNIGVETDNSYTAEGIGVHNCWNLQMDLTGSALTWMVPNKLGTPYELYPIPTALAIPQPAVNPDYPDGYYRIQPVYPYGPFSSYPTPAAAVGAAIPAQWMMRFKYPHPLIRYEGYSPLTAMRSHIDQHESMDRARWYAMKRGVNPAAVLQFEDMEGAQPFPEEAIERIKADFENEHYGTENWSKLYVTAPGSKLEPFGNRPIDMDFQGGWEQVASFILGGGFGITKPAAGMSEASAYANLFASLKQLYWQTLDPKCSRIARKLTRFLGPYFGDDLIIEVHCKRIDDHEILFQKIDKAVSSKAVTKNGVLKLLDLPVTQEEWGDDIAGDPSPYEKEQQEKQMAPEGGGMPGMPGGMPGMDAGAAPAPGAPGMPGGPPEDEVPAALTPEQAPEAAGAATPTAPGEESDTPSITEILGLGVPETEGDQTSEEPNPESLDQQSLGHRKGLSKSLSPRDLQRELRKRQKAIARNYHRKSMYEQMMKVLESGPGEKHHTNGHTNEHLNGSTNGHAK